MNFGKGSTLAVMFSILLCQTIFAVGGADDRVDELRLNHIQIIGTHNDSMSCQAERI